MPTIAEWSLAVIAGAFVIAVIALIPALWQVRRTARQAEEVLAGINRTLPGMLTDLHGVVQKLAGAADALNDLAPALDRLSHLAATAGQAMDHVREVIVPSVASAAGLFAALREGVQWMRPSRNKGRDGS